MTMTMMIMIMLSRQNREEAGRCSISNLPERSFSLFAQLRAVGVAVNPRISFSLHSCYRPIKEDRLGIILGSFVKKSCIVFKHFFY